jgi:uncharacterized protein
VDEPVEDPESVAPQGTPPAPDSARQQTPVAPPASVPPAPGSPAPTPTDDASPVPAPPWPQPVAPPQQVAPQQFAAGQIQPPRAPAQQQPGYPPQLPPVRHQQQQYQQPGYPLPQSGYQQVPPQNSAFQPQQPTQQQPTRATPVADQPSWASYARPLSGVQDGYNSLLHERDWEGQLAASARGPMQWGFLAFFIGLGVFYLLGLVLTPLFNSVFTNFDSTSNHSDGPLLVVEFVPNLAFALFPLIFSWWKGSGPNRDFGLKLRIRDLWIGLACGGISFGLGFLVNLLLQRFVYAGSPSNNTLHTLTELSNGRTIWLALFALFTFIGAPVTEELLFRGALWGALESFKIHRYAILALVTLVFAFAHQEPQQTLALFCQGLAIGSARMITGRISSSMVAHATNNLIPALGLFFAS